MQRTLTTVILLIVLGVGGFFGFQQYQAIQARRAEQARQVAAAAKLRAQQAALDATRHEVETQLRPMKVTSIMPGQPGLAIIDKKEYAEGDELPLPKGRNLRVTAVRDTGIQLAYNGLTFHLDPPAAPDLTASRKPR